MESFTKADKRTNYCGTLNSANIGERVTVTGWCQRQRDLGSLIFIDLRDRTGIVQLAFDDATDREIFDKAFGIRAEFVLAAHGTVRSRGEGAINKNIPTGEIEVYVDSLKILTAAQTPPFAIVEKASLMAYSLSCKSCINKNPLIMSICFLIGRAVQVQFIQGIGN